MNEPMVMTPDSPTRPPRENLVRAAPASFEIREAEDNGMPTLRGDFAVFDQWTEIDSMHEGHFMERVAHGAFDQTIAENRKSMKVTFNHGHDPHIGDKVLGPIENLTPTNRGVSYQVPLLDTSYNRDLIPGLKAGLYGSSFRFTVTGEDLERKPERSDYNPEGIPERTITKARVFEFGPVTYPAYEGATAGARSLTDEFVFGRLVADKERLRQLVEFENTVVETPAASNASGNTERAETEQPKETVRETPEPIKEATKVEDTAKGVNLDRFATKADLENRDQEISDRLQAIHTEHGTRALEADVQNEWTELEAEQDAIKVRVAEITKREARVTDSGSGTREPAYVAPQVIRKSENPFDMDAVRRDSRSEAEEHRTLRDNARKVIDQAYFSHPEVNQEDSQEKVARLLATRDENAAVSRRILATGSELYSRAFGKYITNELRTPEEDRALQQAQTIDRALSLTGAAGGFAVPFTLDPTILATSNGAVNPWRQLARVEQITGDEWRGVTSAGVTVAYAAEATETTDNAPTLVQPTISTEKAQAFIPFSIEVGMDWTGLQSEMARLLADGKDELEAVKFATGTGTNEPFGVITGATNTVNATAAGVFSIANLYALMAALPPRYRPRASFAGNLAILQKVRQFETTGGSSAAVWQDGMQAGLPDRLLGQGVFEASAMSAVTTVGALFLIYGDFSRFIIVDRIGLNVEVIQHLVGTNHRPTGQRGLYAYFRNGSKVVDANAFRVLIGLA